MEITSGVEIARPAEEVFAVVADFARNPEWQGGMEHCAWTTPPPHGVGSRYAQRARFLGRPIVTEFEVTAYEPGRSVSIASVQSTFPIQVTRTVEPLGPERCRVTARVRGEPGGLFRLLGPLLRAMVKRSVDRDYAALRRLLEDG